MPRLVTDEEISEYLQKEDIIFNEGIHFSRIHNFQERYIPIAYDDQLKTILKKYNFIKYKVFNPIFHEKWFITKFEKKNLRYHLKIKYKYFYIEKERIILYYFWVQVHQDKDIKGKKRKIHEVKERGFKCPFCDYMIKKDKWDFPLHFKNEHIKIKTKQLYNRDVDVSKRILFLKNKNIKEINGFGNFPNIEILYLGKNQITEIKGLDNLTKLQKLDLKDNKIFNITGLNNKTSLISLNLSKNNLKRLDGLENLANLTDLNVRGNPLEDVTALKSLPNLGKLEIDIDLMKKNKGQLIYILKKHKPHVYKRFLIQFVTKKCDVLRLEDPDLYPHKWYELRMDTEKMWQSHLEDHLKNKDADNYNEKN